MLFRTLTAALLGAVCALFCSNVWADNESAPGAVAVAEDCPAFYSAGALALAPRSALPAKLAVREFGAVAAKNSDEDIREGIIRDLIVDNTVLFNPYEVSKKFAQQYGAGVFHAHRGGAPLREKSYFMDSNYDLGTFFTENRGGDERASIIERHKDTLFAHADKDDLRVVAKRLIEGLSTMVDHSNRGLEQIQSLCGGDPERARKVIDRIHALKNDPRQMEVAIELIAEQFPRYLTSGARSSTEKYEAFLSSLRGRNPESTEIDRRWSKWAKGATELNSELEGQKMLSDEVSETLAHELQAPGGVSAVADKIGEAAVTNGYRLAAAARGLSDLASTDLPHGKSLEAVFGSQSRTLGQRLRGAQPEIKTPDKHEVQLILSAAVEREKQIGEVQRELLLLREDIAAALEAAKQTSQRLRQATAGATDPHAKMRLQGQAESLSALLLALPTDLAQIENLLTASVQGLNHLEVAKNLVRLSTRSDTRVSSLDKLKQELDEYNKAMKISETLKR